MEFADRQLTCLDCGQPFTFTAGEQEFYERKGFKEEPKRCKNCREARKTRRAGGGGSNGGNGNGYGSREGREVDGNRAAGGSGGGGGGRMREMFDAVCASCGQPARVPFRPVPGRPVYCRDCYGQRSA
jgi:CxxC-x17-CxxC domain-containing protein